VWLFVVLFLSCCYVCGLLLLLQKHRNKALTLVHAQTTCFSSYRRGTIYTYIGARPWSGPLGYPANIAVSSSSYVLNMYSQKQRNKALTLAHAQTILYKKLGHPIGQPARQSARSLFCDYSSLAYVRVPVLYRVHQVEYGRRVNEVAPQEYVNTDSTPSMDPLRTRRAWLR